MQNFRNGCLNCILRVYRSVLVKHLFSNISSFSDLHQKIISLLAKNVRQGFRNCLLCVHMDHFERIFHLKQLHTHKSFLDIRQNVICFLSIVLRKCCQNCFLSVHRIILRKLFCEKKMLLNLGFGKLAKIYRLSQKKSIKLPKLSSTRPKGSFA